MYIPRVLRILSSLLVLTIASQLFGQGGALERVKLESQRLRSFTARSGDAAPAQLTEVRGLLQDLRDATRDWIESELPADRSGRELNPQALQSRMWDDLRRVGLSQPDELRDRFGYISRFDVIRPEEYPEALVFIVGDSVPCGKDDTVYVYCYEGGRRVRLLESHSTHDWGQGILEAAFSRPGEQGERLMLIARYGVQCGSSWNMFDYRLFRLDGGCEPAAEILSDSHSVWLGASVPYRLMLKPDRFLLELKARSIDNDVHNRTHVMNYRVDAQGVRRVEPFALQPQDFVDEWLSLSWDEIAQASGTQKREKLAQWHKILHAASGEYRVVQDCAAKPGQWQIGIDFGFLDEKKLPEDLAVYFVVQDEGNHRYRMIDISFTRQPGCPGQSLARPGSPSLFEPKNDNR